MAAFSLTTWILLFVVVPASVVSGQEVITAESVQNAILTCRAPNDKTNHVEWRRTDLGKEYVLLCRDEHFLHDNQHPSFKNRVDLQDRQMKDGDVSLILNNLMINDTGTYECRVFMEETRSWKSVCNITLRVVDPPGQTGGHTEAGGKEAGGKEAGGKEAGGKEVGGKEAGGKEDGRYALTAGLSVTAVLIVAVVGFVMYRKHKAQQKQVSYMPPIELQPV